MLCSEHVCKALVLLMFYWLICQESGIHSQFTYLIVSSLKIKKASILSWFCSALNYIHAVKLT